MICPSVNRFDFIVRSHLCGLYSITVLFAGSTSHPQTAAQTLAHAPGDDGIAQRWREFISADPELPSEDFPAWLLIADLSQRSHVPPALAPDNRNGRVYCAVHQLVTTDGEMQARMALHALRPDLLKIFLDRRRAAYDAVVKFRTVFVRSV